MKNLCYLRRWRIQSPTRYPGSKGIVVRERRIEEATREEEEEKKTTATTETNINYESTTLLYKFKLTSYMVSEQIETLGDLYVAHKLRVLRNCIGQRW